MSESNQVVQIIEKAKSLPTNEGISYLLHQLEGINNICFDCLDDLLVIYKINPVELNVQTFKEKCLSCVLMHAEKSDGYV